MLEAQTERMTHEKKQNRRVHTFLHRKVASDLFARCLQRDRHRKIGQKNSPSNPSDRPKNRVELQFNYLRCEEAEVII